MFRALVLGAVQGLTEFIPISSSGHLVLVPFLLRWPVPSLAFDVAVHLGTSLGVLAYFAPDLVRMLIGAARFVLGRGGDEDRDAARLVGLLALASVPVAAIGYFFEGSFEALFTDLDAVERAGAPVAAIALVVTAALLLAAEAAHARRPAGRRTRVGTLDAVVIGVLQALALVPGVSRSGATISAGVFRGLSREVAARFSFLLSLPAIIGAGIIALPDIPPGADLGPLIGAAGVAAVSGFAAIAFLLRYLRTRTLRPFAAYCLLLAAVALALWFQIR